ncbi:VRR-NUC domain-containing protein [Paenibacillus polymyxa]|uniref:Nuclease n=1 Tax=Paenibacillus polymyxa TaxID=1406 RepID=A0ABX2ZEG9_PAEPO|nr:VRR-NUC domain-containing protein [Paenibacillus polymyxa]ODA08711.1 nuclease [Paenibacillus polymyxa]
MLESRIEKRLQEKIKKRGGLALKFVSPGQRGVPDRLVLLPGGRMIFVELKRPGAKPEPLQAWWHDKLTALGFDVRVFDTLEGVDAFVQEVMPDEV